MKKIVIKFRDSDDMMLVRFHDGAKAGHGVVAAVGLLMELTKKECLTRSMAKRLADKLNAYADGLEDDED